MGCTSAGINQRVEINVATLNYSGILKSPYEFYEKYDEDQRKLSEIMKSIINANKPEFTLDFGPLDKQWQQQRYSPLYNSTCGIKNNIHLMSPKQFEEQWDEYKDNCLDLITAAYQKFMKEKPNTSELDFYLKNMKTFDRLVYQAILQNVYCENEESKKAQFRQDLKLRFDELKLDFKKFKQYQKKKFQKPFLDQNKKIEMTLKAIDDLDLDIVFLQEANLKLVQAIEQRSKKLRIVKSTFDGSERLACQSIIIIRENPIKFPKFKSLMEENTRLTNNIKHLKDPTVVEEYLTQEQIKELNFNSDTVVQFLYNIILICPHLSSKKDRNKDQIKKLKDKLTFLKIKFPSCYIIVGGDLNNKEVESFKIEKNQDDFHEDEDEPIIKNEVVFNVVPDWKHHYTAKKMRTYLQAQQSKADNLNFEVKDYFITDLQITKSAIKTVKGQVIYDCLGLPAKNQKKNESEIVEKEPPSKDHLLPSEDHPYDHYLLTATLVANKGLTHVSSIEYRFKYKPSLLTHDDLEFIHQCERERKWN